MDERGQRGAPWIPAAGDAFSRSHAFDAQQASDFARAAGDENPLHHDADFAAATPYGGLLVSGTQTAALMMGLAATHFSQRAGVVGTQFSFEFLKPVFVTEQVALQWAVAAVEPRRKGGYRVLLQGAVASPAGELRIRASGAVLILASP